MNSRSQKRGLAGASVGQRRFHLGVDVRQTGHQGRALFGERFVVHVEDLAALEDEVVVGLGVAAQETQRIAGHRAEFGGDRFGRGSLRAGRYQDRSAR